MAYQTSNPGIGKPWPLGLVVVVAAGTPVAANINIDKNPGFNQLWFKNPNATATIYITRAGQAYDSTFSQTLWYLLPREYIFLNANSMGVDLLNPGDFSIDTDTDGAGTVITGIQTGGIG
jgi:hypothetical protein